MKDSIQLLGDLGRLYGTDKVTTHQFENYYGAHFADLRDQELTVLELGIGGEDYEIGGGSLKVWRDFFPRGRVIGVDIYDKSELTEERIHIETGDGSDPEFIKFLVEKYGPFDIIIDDASHRTDQTMRSLFHLFHHVKEDGWYIVEDIQTSYWPTHGGASGAINLIDTPIAWMKHAIDIINRRDIYAKHHPLNAGFKIKELHVYQNIAFLRAGNPLGFEKPALPDKIAKIVKRHEEEVYGRLNKKIQEFEQDRLKFFLAALDNHSIKHLLKLKLQSLWKK